jgi:hypothetical protein
MNIPAGKKGLDRWLCCIVSLLHDLALSKKIGSVPTALSLHLLPSGGTAVSEVLEFVAGSPKSDVPLGKLVRTQFERVKMNGLGEDDSWSRD